MSTTITRRNLLKFAGGSALGLLFTPLPWKLLDDSAIWTQNGPWIPKALRGPISFRYTTCTLCPAGCGVKARMVGTQPVSLSGIPEHPVSQGVLCAAGLGGHHLPYLPDRLDQPVSLTVNGGIASPSPVTRESAIKEIAHAIRERSGNQLFVVLDEQPGRASSQVYHQFIQSLPNARYAVHPNSGHAALETLAGMFDTPCGPLGYDLEHTRTLLSIGAPLFDGWTTPGRMAGMAHGSARIIQVESRYSRTSTMADERVPIRPGTELAFVLALSHCVLNDLPKMSGTSSVSGASFVSLVKHFSPEEMEPITGVTVAQMHAIARHLMQERPSLVIPGADAGGGPLGRDETQAIWVLNFILGSMGTHGGVVSKRVLPFEDPKQHTASLLDIPDQTVGVLLVDAATSGSAVPVSLLARKMAPGGIVVSLSPYLRGGVVHKGYVIPTTAPFESYDDTPTPFDAARASYSVAAQLFKAPENSITPVEFIGSLAAALGSGFTVPTHEDLLKNRVAAIHQQGEGTVFVPAERRSIPVSDIGTSDEMWQLMIAGSCWVDDKSGMKRLPNFVFPGSERITAWKERALQRDAAPGYPLALFPYGWNCTAGRGQVSPLFTKLYQESGLRSGKDRIFINPETGRLSHLVHGGTALLTTPVGSDTIKVAFDASVMPGVIEAPIGPEVQTRRADHNAPLTNDILALCEIGEGGTWRVTPASLAEARA